MSYSQRKFNGLHAHDYFLFYAILLSEDYLQGPRHIFIQ